MHFNDLLLSLTLLPAVFAAPVIESRDDSRFTLYDLPTVLTGPCDLEVDPNGMYLWGQGITDNIFFRLDPSTGHVDEYPIPFTTPLSAQPIQLPGVLKSITDRTALSCAIRKGADGNLYAGNGLRNQLVRINPITKKIDIFEPTPLNPLGNLLNFNDLYTAKDGIWVTATTGNTFSFFSFATETFESHTVPTPLALPLGLKVASNGVVYVAELLGNQILTYDPKTNITTEYPLPELAQFPAVIRAERNGYIYFSLFVGNGIGRISMTTGTIDLYHTDQIGLLGSEDTIDKYGGVWLSSFTSDVISRLDTNTNSFSYVALPETFAQVGLPGVLGDIPPYVDIAVNYGPGDNIWFTGLTFNQVGSYNISGLYSSNT
ncbi:Hypothetical protein R9X50_00537200 [Acrodontium crateriforme]|uniref:NHL repeat-containing protein n=1 Tax=Acrodontium crateriforme TaxID=150365 RepID=A0AAQ3MCI5_9PEZI|nr:Hypothetical protein R9X50_00537200 [Acrodontium crateriforme]